MKSIAICIFTLFSFVFVGCKQQKEEKQGESEVVVEETVEEPSSAVPQQSLAPSERYFIDNPVAKIENGKIEYTDYDAFFDKWKLFTGKRAVIDSIGIKEVNVEGVDDKFYTVIAVSGDKKTKFSSLLIERDSKLYYYAPQDVVVMVMCMGCVDDCDVVVSKTYEGEVSLSCSNGCPDCVKREGIFQLRKSE